MASLFQLSPQTLAKIRLIGLEQSPLEACGVVCPDDLVVRCRNMAENPEREFLIRASDLRDAIERFFWRTANTLIPPSQFIIWHTHPSGIGIPSPADLAHADGLFQYCLIPLPDGLPVFYASALPASASLPILDDSAPTPDAAPNLPPPNGILPDDSLET